MGWGEWDVETLARQAALALEPDEVEGLTQDLRVLLDHYSGLEALESQGLLVGLEPMTRGTGLNTTLREDRPGESLSRDAVLAEAPDHDGAAFVVPLILQSVPPAVAGE